MLSKGARRRSRSIDEEGRYAGVVGLDPGGDDTSSEPGASQRQPKKKRKEEQAMMTMPHRPYGLMSPMKRRNNTYLSRKLGCAIVLAALLLANVLINARTLGLINSLGLALRGAEPYSPLSEERGEATYKSTSLASQQQPKKPKASAPPDEEVSELFCSQLVPWPETSPEQAGSTASFMHWVKRQAVVYQQELCTAHPRSVGTFEEHVPFEREYIERHLFGTLPSYEEAKAQIFPEKRGVVFTARTAADQLDMVLRTVRLLREQDEEQLPVEVWFSEVGADAEAARAHELCSAQQVSCRSFFDDEVLGALTPALLLKSGFAFCIYAIALSGFEQVLFLDVDAAPMRDVSHLFSSDLFEDTGQLFYADFWGSTTSNAGETAHADSPLWDFVKVAPYGTREFESSVLLLDKSRHWRALNLVLHLTRHRQLMDKRPPRGYPKVVHGDKDIWRIAFLYLRTKMHVGLPAMLGHASYLLFFQRESFGHLSPAADDVVLFVHQPKIMELPRWSRLTTAIVDVHCTDPSRGYFTYGGFNFWDYWPCTFGYDYKTGRMHGGKSSWETHSCVDAASSATATCKRAPLSQESLLP